MDARILALLLLVPFAHAHGHGQGLDTITGVSAGDRDLTITVEMPLAFEGGRDQITITAADGATGEAASDVTFLVGLFRGDEMLFRNYFFARDGSLELAVEPTGAGGVEIRGERTGPLEAWEGDPVEVSGPVLDSGGLYRFEIEVRTVDDPANVVEGGSYEADVSVADSYHFPREGPGGGQAGFEVRSYFDAVESLEYDPAGGAVAFTMPFDWGEAKISHIPVVHAELRFPKSSPFNAPGYEGYANGVELFRASVVIDDYTREGERVVHFVLLEDHLRSVKRQLDPLPGTLELELRATDTLEVPLSGYTRGEDYEVSLSWDPREIEPGTETQFVFTIRDGATGEPLRDSDYTFVLLSGGEEIHRASGTARIGGHFERFAFSEEHAGPVTVRFEDIRGSGLETEFGIAVVPEFGAAALALAAGMGAAAYVRARRA